LTVGAAAMRLSSRLAMKLPEVPEKLRARWPLIRALLIALHITAVFVVSFPHSKIADPKRWKLKRTQDEFALWAERLTQWGWAYTSAELEANLWKVAQSYLAVRHAVAAPFEPYTQLTDAKQRWGMFRAPNRTPYALLIEVRESRKWRTIYLSRSSEHVYLQSTLENNRFRKLLGRIGRDRRLFRRIATWVARRAFDDYPNASHVRARVLMYTSLKPEEVRAGKPRPQRTHRVRRFKRGQLK